jgi:hypothetical protein
MVSVDRPLLHDISRKYAGVETPLVVEHAEERKADLKRRNRKDTRSLAYDLALILVGLANSVGIVAFTPSFAWAGYGFAIIVWLAGYVAVRRKANHYLVQHRIRLSFIKTYDEYLRVRRQVEVSR